jgi:hypothetical protein
LKMTSPLCARRSETPGTVPASTALPRIARSESSCWSVMPWSCATPGRSSETTGAMPWAAGIPWSAGKNSPARLGSVRVVSDSTIAAANRITTGRNLKLTRKMAMPGAVIVFAKTTVPVPTISPWSISPLLILPAH